jgi:catechol 2,3-dioxygenase-like lactoylglutathione lyase family enzyme
MNLIAFQCDDLAATVDMMKANGVRIIETDPTHIMVHPKSTHGVLLQLVEKDPNAPRATKAGQVPDTSGVVGIVSYKCTVVFVKDAAKAIESYEALGLKLHVHSCSTGTCVAFQSPHLTLHRADLPTFCFIQAFQLQERSCRYRASWLFPQGRRFDRAHWADVS